MCCLCWYHCQNNTTTNASQLEWSTSKFWVLASLTIVVYNIQLVVQWRMKSFSFVELLLLLLWCYVTSLNFSYGQDTHKSIIISALFTLLLLAIALLKWILGRWWWVSRVALHGTMKKIKSVYGEIYVSILRKSWRSEVDRSLVMLFSENLCSFCILCWCCCFWNPSFWCRWLDAGCQALQQDIMFLKRKLWYVHTRTLLSFTTLSLLHFVYVPTFIYQQHWYFHEMVFCEHPTHRKRMESRFSSHPA